MTKTIEQLLAQFKRANKQRRERLAVINGFKNEQDYKDFLGGKKDVERILPIIHNVYILDCSGSMSEYGKLRIALEGINSEIEELKKNREAEFTQTLVTFSFSHDIRMVNNKTRIENMERVYAKAGGMTALYQAVGETISKLLKEAKSGEKYLIKIFTDGEENASEGKWANKNNLKDLIADAEERGFTITFVGTDEDVNKVVQNININISNTFSHQNTAETVTDSFEAYRSATKQYVSKVAKGEDVKRGFFKTVGKL